MRLVDTHCHLQDNAFDEDRDAVLANALDKLAWLVVVGDDLASSREALELVQDRVHATVGIHPHHASEIGPEALDEIRMMSASTGVAAIGEIGLDYYYDFAPKKAQRDVFEAQLHMASELELPVVIHCRDAQQDMLDILDAIHGKLAGGVMHCFPGGPDFARQCLDWGFYISFAGNVTFNKARELRDSAAIVPLDRLLVETDCPYLTPVPRRGRRCEPTDVAHTASLLADIKGVSSEVFAEQTSHNAAALFGVA